MADTTHFYQLFEPEHYNVYLDINRETKKITGKTTIAGEAKAEKISIHQKYMNIESILADGQKVAFTTDDSADAIRIDLGKRAT